MSAPHDLFEAFVDEPGGGGCWRPEPPPEAFDDAAFWFINFWLPVIIGGAGGLILAMVVLLA